MCGELNFAHTEIDKKMIKQIEVMQDLLMKNG